MIIYIITINIVGLIMMAIDKNKARRQKFRIPETMLFFIAMIGGSFGIFLGMYQFRHKTKKVKFYLGIPIIIIVQAVLLGLLLTC